MATSNPVRKSEKKLRIHVSKHGDLKTEKYLELINNIVLAKLQVEQKLFYQLSRDENARISALTNDEILEEEFEKNAEANAIANATEKKFLKNKKKNKKKKEKAKAKKKKIMEDSPPKDILPCLDTVLAHIEILERLY